VATKAQKRQQRAEQFDYGDIKQAAEQAEKGFAPTCFTIPEGMELIRLKKDKKHRWDVIGYVCGDKNPEMKEGKFYHNLSYWVHPRIGPSGKWFPCNAKNGRGRCAACERLSKLRFAGEADEDTREALNPKHRHLFYVVDRDDKDKGVQLFETPHYGKGQGFGEMLYALVQDIEDEDDPRRRFHSPSEGMTLVFKAKEESFPGGTFAKPLRMDFVPRQSQYKSSLWKDLPSLEDLVATADYKKLKSALEGVESGGDDDQDVALTDENVGDECKARVNGKWVEGEIKSVNEKKGTAVVKTGPRSDAIVKFEDIKLVGEDVDDEEEIDDPEDNDTFTEDEDEEEEKPKKKGKKKPAEEDEDEDEDAEDADDEEGEEEDEEDSEDDEDAESGDEEDEDDDDDGGDDDATADELGIEVGSVVKHKRLGVCEVTHVSRDGTAVRLKPKRGPEQRGVAPGECELIEEEEEEEEKPKKGKAKAAKKGKKEPAEDEEEEEPEEEEEDDEAPFEEDEDFGEEEEEEEKPKKKGNKKGRK
jgi:hypothetical protein